MKKNYTLLFAFCFLLFSSVVAQTNDCGNNAGFENGTTSGWVCKTGTYGTGSCLGPCAPNCTSFLTVLNTPGCINPSGPNAPVSSTTDFHTIMSGSGTDPNSLNTVPVVAPGGGNYSLRLGTGGGHTSTTNTGYGSNLLSAADAINFSFVVTPQNAGFTYRYAAFLQDAGHAPEKSPRFEVAVMDSAGNALSCGNLKIVAGFLPLCKNTANFKTGPYVGAGIWKYCDWTDVPLDLTAYIGSTVTIEFRVSGCYPPFGEPSITCVNKECNVSLGTTGYHCYIDSLTGACDSCKGVYACPNNYNAGAHMAYAYIDAYCNIVPTGCNLLAVPETLNDNSFKIFPNPSKGVFNISLETKAIKDLTIRVTDVLGKEIYYAFQKNAGTNYKKEISLSSHPDGIYFVRIESGDRIWNRKVVINRP